MYDLSPWLTGLVGVFLLFCAAGFSAIATVWVMQGNVAGAALATGFTVFFLGMSITTTVVASARKIIGR